MGVLLTVWNLDFVVPGPLPNTGEPNSFILLALCWFLIAFALYILRPSSLRRQEGTKPGDPGQLNTCKTKEKEETRKRTSFGEGKHSVGFMRTPAGIGDDLRRGTTRKKSGSGNFVPCGAGSMTNRFKYKISSRMLCFLLIMAVKREGRGKAGQ
ncbi:unnamed protein product [Darwinula stevensoni]|uniref:Uncharacterized protein n=1 Tax=Darwinula stevensoni TaxID=69355 RepID=A0A7R8ZXQ2_9CRUS|nr:unnamed protein product [Darwinula stevensoni]CAG0878914.1 unnamed protein product [Darwinula stevensoni]